MIAKATPKATADGVPVYCAHDAIVDAATLVPNPKNPNTHPDNQIQLLGRIIRQAGWRQPIAVSNRSGFIVKGHGRLAAALLEGFKEVPVDYQEYATEADEYADLVADNRIAELAEIDQKMLADIFADIDLGEIPVELTGYTEEEVADLVAALSESLHNDLNEPDAVPELPESEDTITQKGDLWILGRHRLLCGDSTERKAVALLMGGENADISVTSPPYGVSNSAVIRERYKPGEKKIETFYNEHEDKQDGWPDLICAALENMAEFSEAQFVNIQMLADNKKALVEIVAKYSGMLCDVIVWDKKKAPPQMQKNVLNNQYEFIFVFDERGTRSIRFGNFHGNVNNVIECSTGQNEYAAIHRAVYPVALVEKIIEINSKAGSVLDLFGGTGTTLIAAESTGRTSYLMELDPKYCDVIVKRYINATGDKAGVKLLRNGKELSSECFRNIFDDVCRRTYQMR